MPKFEITRARAFGKDVLYAAGMTEDAEAQEPFTRVFRFLDGAWEHVDVDISTQRICRYERPDGGKIAVFMSHDGVLFSPEPSFRGGPIVDPKQATTKRLGRLSDLRQIGRTLVACGDGGQFYYQLGDGTWSAFDLAFFDDKIDSRWVFEIQAQGNTGAEQDAYWKAHPDEKAELDRRLKLYTKVTALHAIAGPSLDKLYMASSKGSIYFWNGHHTVKLASPVSSYLTDILVEDEDIVWICGRDGTLLRGNATEGFVEIPCAGDPMFSKITKFQGNIYLSSYADPRGAFCFDGKRISRVDSGIRGGLEDVHTVDGVSDALWAVGSRELARFDGSKWEKVAFPK